MCPSSLCRFSGQSLDVLKLQLVGGAFSMESFCCISHHLRIIDWLQRSFAKSFGKCHFYPLESVLLSSQTFSRVLRLVFRIQNPRFWQNECRCVALIFFFSYGFPLLILLNFRFNALQMCSQPGCCTMDALALWQGNNLQNSWLLVYHSWVNTYPESIKTTKIRFVYRYIFPRAI